MSPMDEANAELLRAVIALSGLSARRFAAEVMARDERTIRRWLAAEMMPETVAAWLMRVESIKPPVYRKGKLIITLRNVEDEE